MEKFEIPSAEQMKKLEDREYKFDNETDLLAKWLYEGNEATDEIYVKCMKVCGAVMHRTSL